MKLLGLSTAVALLALAGAASAECAWGKYDATTAGEAMTPVPTADASETVETPILILPDADAETADG